MANGDIPAGWYPDPSGTGGERWWDGAGWTEHVRSQPTATAPEQPEQPQVPAGWYPDPSGAGGQRWWDGAQWTDHVQAPTPVEPVAEPEPQPEPVPATSQVPAGWYPDPSGAGGQRWWDGVQWTDHVQAVSVDVRAESPVSEAVAAEATPRSPEIAAGWYSDPAGSGGQRWWDGSSWTDHVQAAPGVVRAEADTAAPAQDTSELPATGDERAMDTREIETSDGAGDVPDDLEDDEPSGADDDAASGEGVDVGSADGSDGDVAASEDVGEDTGATSDAEASGVASGAIPAGWYADPSGQGERWWTGDAWSEQVRTPPGAPGEGGADRSDVGASDPVAPEAQPTENEATQAPSPVDPATGTAGPADSADTPGSTAGAGSLASQVGHQDGFSMTGVGAVPPTGPPPGGDDGGGGGSRKLIVIVLLVVVLLAAVGAALWFFTDVFDQAQPAVASVSDVHLALYTNLSLDPGVLMAAYQVG